MKSVGVWLKRGTLLFLAFLAVAQFIPIKRDDPQIDPTRSIYAKEKMPQQVKSVFEGSCANCHSDRTAWPWYSYVAPVSWIIASDVHEARKKMNLSEWADYPANKREEKLEDICEQLTNGDMPDFKYVLVHRAARVTKAQRDAVCQWTEDSRQY
jgi:mono/diheme cytochrome c family protein